MNLDIFNIKAKLQQRHERQLAEQARAEQKAAKDEQRRKNLALRDAVTNGDVGAIKDLLAKSAYSEDNEQRTSVHGPTALQIAREKMWPGRGTNYANPRCRLYIDIAELLRENALSRLTLEERMKRFSAMEMDPNSLHKAVFDCRISDVKYLLDRRAGAADDASYGVRDLVDSLYEGKLEIAKMLIEHGVAVNTPWAGDMPLEKAVWNHFPDMVKLLLEHGANPHHVDSVGVNYLVAAAIADRASYRGEPDNRAKTIKLLIDAGVSPDVTSDRCGWGSARKIITHNREYDLLALVEKRFGKAPVPAATTATEFSASARKPVATPPARRDEPAQNQPWMKLEVC